MRNFVPCLRNRLMFRVAAVALAASSVAACSSDSTRFGESPFSNPFSSASADRSSPPTYEPAPEQTAAIQPAPSSRVERAPLSAPNDVQSRPMYGYGQGEGSYRSSSVEPRASASVSAPRMQASVSAPRVAPARIETARIEPSVRAPRVVAAAPSASSNWSSSGGTTVTLGRGETIQSISRRYGVPTNAILQANGLSSTSGVGEGRQIVIPAYSVGAQASVQRPVAPKATVVASLPEPQVKARFVEGPKAKALVEARAVAPKAEIKVAAPKLAEVKVAAPAVAEVKVVEPAKPALKVAVATPAKVVVKSSEQAFVAAPAKVSTPAADVEVKTAALKVETPQADKPAAPSFRWPARGRIISGYGSKSSGASNDGVNIAVPEGTEIKASDDGVVAYSGSELKGFGNLVLIRHSNGWVTAYAHNSALNVKRGETVRRGQVIAKSGSTGSVSSPQLHFEVRKGAQAVDPIKHLPDA